MAPKKKRVVRKNWKALAEALAGDLKQVKEQLRLANMAAETAQKGEEEARAEISELTEKWESLAGDVLRLSTELEEKAEALLASKASEEAARTQNIDLVRRNDLLTSAILRMHNLQIEGRKERNNLKAQLAAAEMEIDARRRLAGLLAAFHMHDKGVVEAAQSLIDLAISEGMDARLLTRSASEAFKTGARIVHNLAFKGIGEMKMNDETAHHYQSLLLSLQQVLEEHTELG